MIYLNKNIYDIFEICINFASVLVPLKCSVNMLLIAGSEIARIAQQIETFVNRNSSTPGSEILFA